MPIYEFRCLKCNEFFELLFMNKEETVETKCPKCHSQEFERVLSSTGFSINHSQGDKKGPTRQTRTCSSGSCTTYTIPGPHG